MASPVPAPSSHARASGSAGTTPGLKWEIHFTTPSSSKVDSNQGNTPKVLGIGALRRRNYVFLYHETLLKRNVAFEILTCDLTWPSLSIIIFVRQTGYFGGEIEG
jgi:hypothetical protein